MIVEPAFLEDDPDLRAVADDLGIGDADDRDGFPGKQGASRDLADEGRPVLDDAPDREGRQRQIAVDDEVVPDDVARINDDRGHRHGEVGREERPWRQHRQRERGGEPDGLARISRT